MTPQTQASAPATSAWVAASAGTGKTRVLIERVLRLLLAGAAANHILCITFTRAAAAEIAERIHQRLGVWAICSEAELVKALGDALGRAPDRADLETARGLFTRVLDSARGRAHQDDSRVLRIAPGALSPRSEDCAPFHGHG